MKLLASGPRKVWRHIEKIFVLANLKLNKELVIKIELSFSHVVYKIVSAL